MKGQKRVQEKTKGQEPLHGQAGHLVMNGQPEKSHGKDGCPILQMLDMPGVGASSYDAMSSTSEASSRGTWHTSGYGKPKSGPTASWESQGEGKPPWRKD